MKSRIYLMRRRERKKKQKVLLIDENKVGECSPPPRVPEANWRAWEYSPGSSPRLGTITEPLSTRTHSHSHMAHGTWHTLLLHCRRRTAPAAQCPAPLPPSSLQPPDTAPTLALTPRRPNLPLLHGKCLSNTPVRRETPKL